MNHSLAVPPHSLAYQSNKIVKRQLEIPLTSTSFPGEPCPCKQACGDDDRENHWTDEEVPPSQNCFDRKADCESPLDAMHQRQTLRRKSAELPSHESQKYEKYRNEEAESNIEVPQSPAKPLDLEVKGLK